MKMFAIPLLVSIPIVFTEGKLRHSKDVYDKLGDVADFLSDEVDLLKNNKDKANNMRFDDFGIQGQHMRSQEPQLSRDLVRNNGKQNTQIHYHGAALSNMKTHKSKTKMADELEAFPLLKDSDAIKKVLAIIGYKFDQVQKNIQKETSGFVISKLKNELKSYAKQVADAYKIAITNHEFLLKKPELANIIRIGNQDLVVVYDSVYSMILHTEPEGCKSYRSAIDSIVLPQRIMKQKTEDVTELFCQAAATVIKFKTLVKLEFVKLDPGITIQIPENLKNMGRMIEKTVLKRHGDEIGNANKIFDVVRAMIVCETMSMIASVIDMLVANPDIIITRVKDRFFREPSGGKLFLLDDLFYFFS